MKGYRVRFDPDGTAHFEGPGEPMPRRPLSRRGRQAKRVRNKARRQAVKAARRRARQ